MPHPYPSCTPDPRRHPVFQTTKPTATAAPATPTRRTLALPACRTGTAVGADALRVGLALLLVAMSWSWPTSLSRSTAVGGSRTHPKPQPCNPHRPRSKARRPITLSSPAAQPAPPPQPTSAPSEQYVKTPWGTRCQVSTDQITCDTCEPGLLLDTPAGAECPGPSLNEIVVDASGAKQTPATGVILPASPSIQQLAEGQTYDINGWRSNGVSGLTR